MPEEITLQGNNGGYISVNDIIYFGLRGELGYFFDDILLYTIEHHYFKDDTNRCRIYSSDTEFKLIFYSELMRLNKALYNPQRPKYLEISNEEKRNGYEMRNKDNGEKPYHSFKKKIYIPTIDEMLKGYKEHYSINSETLILNNHEKNTNRVVIVGDDDSDTLKVRRSNIKTFQDAANTWRNGSKHYKQIYSNHFLVIYDIVSSGIDAINVLKKSSIGNKPITEIFFSTHGVVYAIDFNNGGNNIYTTITYTKQIVGETWEPKENKALISNFTELVRGGYIAPDVTITLGGCLNGAQIEDLIKTYPTTDNSPEAQRARKFIEINKNKEKTENFAYLLSLSLPKATILAPTTRNNSAEGIIYPVVYQNGLCWFVSYPRNKPYKGKIITGIDGYFNSTIHPLAIL